MRKSKNDKRIEAINNLYTSIPGNELVDTGLIDMGKLKHLKQNLEIYNRLEDKYMVTIEKECLWFYGYSRSGKTYYASHAFGQPGNVYVKDIKNELWDSYQGQEIVIVDNLNRTQMTLSLMQVLSEMAENRTYHGRLLNNKSKTCNFTKLIVTSPHPPICGAEGDEIKMTWVIMQMMSKFKIFHMYKGKPTPKTLEEVNAMKEEYHKTKQLDLGIEFDQSWVELAKKETESKRNEQLQDLNNMIAKKSKDEIKGGPLSDFKIPRISVNPLKITTSTISDRSPKKPLQLGEYSDTYSKEKKPIESNFTEVEVQVGVEKEDLDKGDFNEKLNYKHSDAIDSRDSVDSNFDAGEYEEFEDVEEVERTNNIVRKKLVKTVVDKESSESDVEKDKSGKKGKGKKLTKTTEDKPTKPRRGRPPKETKTPELTFKNKSDSVKAPKKETKVQLTTTKATASNQPPKDATDIPSYGTSSNLDITQESKGSIEKSLNK